MTRFLTIFPALLLAIGHWVSPLQARDVVDASSPVKTAVTVYRDPTRGEGQAMNASIPRGFALISETRRVTLPQGQSTIRFTGVAEGMVAVSAIVTGLPGGAIEKNRDAELLSPAALVNGMLGNRITVSRTNPATGELTSESAIVRTRADGGLVLQTSQGFEAVRCAGLPEKLTFPSVPDGLTPEPVFTINTRDDEGGTYEVTLSYLAWGFDWQAHYVATLDEPGDGSKVRMRLMSWLTVLNDNGQTFEDAELLAVAGTLNVESAYRSLAEPPRAEPLRLTCYPIGSTAAGSPVPSFSSGMLAAPPPAALEEPAIVVTGARRSDMLMEAAADVAMVAEEEQLGDLKLYRVPEAVSVNAQGLKQVAFLDQQDVRGELIYELSCQPWNLFTEDQPSGANFVLETKNEEKRGLGMAMPMGGVTVFEPSAYGDLLVGEDNLRDHAVGQDVEIRLGQSAQVQGVCSKLGEEPADEEAARNWMQMKSVISNANPHRVKLRLNMGSSAIWEVQGVRRVQLKDGNRILEMTIPANGTREVSFQMRLAR